MTAQQKPRLLPVVAVAGFVAFGAYFLGPLEAIRQTLTGWYAPHSGVITKLDVVDDEYTNVEYSFSVHGIRYFGDTISHCSSLSKSEVEGITGPLRKGGQVTVYADASDPAKCVLIRGLTSSGKFGIAWSVLASLGLVASILQFVVNSRSKEELKRRYDEQAECQPGVKRLRLIPGGFKSPASVAAACTIVFPLLSYLWLELGQHLFGWWELRVLLKVAISLAFGIVTAVCDYFYTARGNARGRWDLIVDENQGTLQLPAIGAYRQPTMLSLDDVTGLQLKTLIRPDECESEEGYYRLNVICRQRKLSVVHDVPIENVTEHVVAQSKNRTELEALAKWLNEATGLSLELEEAVANGGLGTLISELRTTSKTVK